MSSLSITLIQSHLHWENVEANLSMFSKKIESIQEKTEVVILPEMFTTGFSMRPELLAENMDGDAMQWMKKTAAQKKVIITGSLMIQEDNKYFNRLIWMQPDGKYAVYNKRHLFAYGNEHEKFTPGTKRLIASVKGWKINLQVCYDLRFPVWARQAVTCLHENKKESEYDILIYVANWPQQRATAWKALLTARAIENQCFVIGVNCVGTDGNDVCYSGESMIVDPLGEILYCKKDEEDIFTYTFHKENLDEIRNKFPFLYGADSFNIIM